MPGALAKSRPEAAGNKERDKKPEVPLEFAPREVVQPALARLPGSVEFSGPLVAPQTAVVRSRAAGTLLSLAVAEGSRVQAGQVLGRIELADLSSRVAERNAGIDSARAALVQAERTHLSNERLAAQQFISQPALEQSRAALEAARANLNLAQATLETTRVALRDGTLLAPISGIVAKRHVLPGEKLSIEQQVLTIVDLARLELAGSVGTHEVSRIQPGMAVQVQVEGVDQPVAGRVARIAPAAEPGTRSIGVTIELPNPKEALRAGQYALARATLADETDRLTLPAAAVGKTSGQDHVWLIENGVLARRAVTVGRRDERIGKVEVLQGVTPTSQVLAARFDNLREGAKALVVAAKSAPVASAAASMPQVR
ncbi:MAG: efflux RND transporter periplasmic adaptor subunit [Rubrivivax sp.]|nr:efflux RND transporter periplasmic adaptor subunit [Rubrivivax sp.]